MRDGIELGATDGNELGDKDGVPMGEPLGVPPGDWEAICITMEGSSEGIDDGIPFGEALIVRDGIELRATGGKELGDEDGVSEGELLGATSRTKVTEASKAVLFLIHRV